MRISLAERTALLCGSTGDALCLKIKPEEIAQW